MGNYPDQILLEFGQHSEDIAKRVIDIICDILFDIRRRFIFDTDVIVAAMRSPSGASAALLGAVLDRRLTMLASVSLFLSTRPNAWIQCIGLPQAYPGSRPTF